LVAFQSSPRFRVGLMLVATQGLSRCEVAVGSTACPTRRGQEKLWQAAHQ
jgi:hypothetical protein